MRRPQLESDPTSSVRSFARSIPSTFEVAYGVALSMYVDDANISMLRGNIQRLVNVGVGASALDTFYGSTTYRRGKSSFASMYGAYTDTSSPEIKAAASNLQIMDIAESFEKAKMGPPQSMSLTMSDFIKEPVLTFTEIARACVEISKGVETYVPLLKATVTHSTLHKPRITTMTGEDVTSLDSIETRELMVQSIISQCLEMSRMRPAERMIISGALKHARVKLNSVPRLIVHGKGLNATMSLRSCCEDGMLKPYLVYENLLKKLSSYITYLGTNKVRADGSTTLHEMQSKSRTRFVKNATVQAASTGQLLLEMDFGGNEVRVLGSGGREFNIIPMDEDYIRGFEAFKRGLGN